MIETGNFEGQPYHSLEDMIQCICFDNDNDDNNDNDNNDDDNDNDDMLQAGHDIYHPSNLGNIQVLLNNSQSESDYSHLSPEMIKRIIPLKDLDTKWLKRFDKS